MFSRPQVASGTSWSSAVRSILLRAAHLEPFGIRSLDAIHLATAIEIHPYIDSIVSYDNRMIEAAESLGLAVNAPLSD